jgi:hypothetical protein
MFRSKSFALIAACAALACGDLARADLAPGSTTDAASAFQPVMLDNMSSSTMAPAASAPAAPLSGGSLMGALRTLKVGQPLDQWGIVATGYVEGSWTYDAHPVDGNILTDRSFDTKAESIIFDQVELNISKAADYTSKNVTFGFTVEQIYGWDAAYLHSNGLSIYSAGKTASPINNGGTTATIHPKAQYDLTQANFVITAPFWNGVGFEGGKFSLPRYESFDGPLNPFYSHSFLFAETPLTQTGALLSAYLTDPASADRVKLTGGFSRGWDQATVDNNGSLDYTGQIAYTKVDTTEPSMPVIYSIALSGITGDEQPDAPVGVAGQDGWRSMLDLVGHYALSDQVSLGAQGMYGWQAQAANGGAGGGNGQWYGTAVYASYAPLSLPMFVFNVRGEWFDDQDGAAPTQLSAAIVGSGVGGEPHTPNVFYEATVGVTIKPFVNGIPGSNANGLDAFLGGLAIRPELRWDYSDHAAFNSGTQHDQWTAAIEAYFAF